jgi:hypothetical protein
MRFGAKGVALDGKIGRRRRQGQTCNDDTHSQERQDRSAIGIHVMH